MQRAVGLKGFYRLRRSVGYLDSDYQRQTAKIGFLSFDSDLDGRRFGSQGTCCQQKRYCHYSERHRERVKFHSISAQSVWVNAYLLFYSGQADQILFEF
jgi:hypothetical protein